MCLLIQFQIFTLNLSSSYVFYVYFCALVSFLFLYNIFDSFLLKSYSKCQPAWQITWKIESQIERNLIQESRRVKILGGWNF